MLKSEIIQLNKGVVMKFANKETTYRESAKPEVKVVPYVRTLEEVIIETREHIPGPIRRLLGLVTIIPVFTCSFLLSIATVPFAWVLFGDAVKCFDSVVDHCCRSSLDRVPVIRGTVALYFSYSERDLDFLRKRRGLSSCLREEERNQPEKSDSSKSGLPFSSQSSAILHFSKELDIILKLAILVLYQGLMKQDTFCMPFFQN